MPTLLRRQGRPADAAPARTLAERGRMLFVRDVLELLPKKADGTPAKGAWWVKHKFAPEQRRKLGRDVYWWEADVLDYLDKEI